KSPVPVVIDHYGLVAGHEPDSPESKAMLDLLALRHVWIKLSAPYRSSSNALEISPHAGWLKAILARAAERSVWGSDWPWTAPAEAQKGANIIAPYRKLDYAVMVDEFLSALGSAALATRIMKDNPARLYD